jgi:hypothetical protein
VVVVAVNAVAAGKDARLRHSAVRPDLGENPAKV